MTRTTNYSQQSFTKLITVEILTNVWLIATNVFGSNGILAHRIICCIFRGKLAVIGPPDVAEKVLQSAAVLFTTDRWSTSRGQEALKSVKSISELGHFFCNVRLTQAVRRFLAQIIRGLQNSEICLTFWFTLWDFFGGISTTEAYRH